MRGVYITYWPAGGGRGQNPCRTGLAQGLELCLKYGPRALCSQFYMSQGRLYVPREVDLADKTRVAALPSSCPPGQPPLGHIGSLGTYRIVTRVPAGRILSTGRALWARPVRQGFCPRPPPAGQYVLYAPLTVYRISGMYNVQ